MRSRAVVLSVALFLVAGLSQSVVSARPLTFEDRVRAQAAIERVYYSGQIGATAPFENAVPRDVIERKVRNYLEKSAALETIWKTPVTAAMLRREVERMVEQTQMPDRLRALFAALDNDSLLIQECLARPVLVDRLAGNFFAYDQFIHGAARHEIETLRQDLLEGRLDPQAAHPRRTIEESKRGIDPDEFERLRATIPADLDVGPVVEEREAFLVHVALQRSEDSFRIATYHVDKETWDDWWTRARNRFERSSIDAVAQEEDPAVDAAIASQAIQAPAGCADDTWDGGFLDEIPDRLAPAVWTGSYMLIWGGSFNDNKGWRYDPVTDTWSPISRVGAPEGRSYHTAVWAGDRMIVQGGRDAFGFLNTGGRYDPITDSWSPTSTLNAPLGSDGRLAVWTGSLMLIWGSDYSIPNTTIWTGARYNPSTDTWSPMSTTNAPPVMSSPYTAVWAAGRMILWNAASSALDRGRRYDPVTDTWASMRFDTAPSRRDGSTAVSTGSQMIVWGGLDYVTGTYANTGGRYDPQTDLWVPTTTTNAPAGRTSHSAVWAGNEMMIWGGCTQAACPSVTGGRYNPQTDSWSAVSPLNAPPTNAAVALWTGSQVLIWGAMSVGNQNNTRAGARYHPVTDSWTPISMGSAPTGRINHSAIWTGSHMVVWGGQGPTVTMTGGRYDPALAAWSATSTLNAPSARTGHSVVWTGQRMIVWGGFDSTGGDTSTGGRYDPLADSWTPTSLSGAPSAREGHSAVWTGDRMVVWGGGTNTGGLYDPEADTWSATSTTNAPSPRSGHAAVWTGRLMLIWGGSVNTGARYDPFHDSWSPMSTTGAPSARSLFSAIWTGSRMLIWGGRSGLNDLSTGGLYDPGTNSWIATPPTQPRSGHTTAWTGSQMVAWGGSAPNSQSATGQRYFPGSSTWSTASSADAPAGRSLHTAVWTGDRMIVWGGLGPFKLNTGGRYCACSGGAVAMYYPDADGDGYGVASAAIPSCSPPAGYSTISGDCDDADPAVHPGAQEICDQKDSDCDGVLPPAERDDDADHYAVCQGDCRDDLPGIHPGAPEGCDGIDTDCDGVVPQSEFDVDGDGFRTCAGDCDDGNPARHPGAPEACNYLDDDCDGVVDEGVPDADGDGRMDCTDCRPSDPNIWAVPPEATNLHVVLQEAGGDYCSWDDLSPASGGTVLYDVFVGSLVALRQGGGFSTGSCLVSYLSYPAFELSAIDPGPPGNGQYIIVRGQNQCGVGTYGSPYRDQTAAASPNACP